MEILRAKEEISSESPGIQLQRKRPDVVLNSRIAQPAMEVGGTQYFIEKDLAAGSVTFGSSNVLNGAQWIQAFESALQTNKPQWWDSHRNGFREENVVLLRYGDKITLVLSPATAKQYQQMHPNLTRIAP